MITERDIKILKFLNDFGYARTSILRKLFFESKGKDIKRTCQRRLKKLFDEDLVKRERDYKYGEHVFYLTKKVRGVLAAHQIQPYEAYKKVSWSTYIHNDYVLQVYLALRSIGYTGYISERSMKYQQLFEKTRPDLVVRDGSGQLFVEVELVAKMREQYEKKFKRLIKQDVPSVYFVQGNQVHQRIQKVAQSLGYELKVMNIDEFIEHPEKLRKVL